VLPITLVEADFRSLSVVEAAQRAGLYRWLRRHKVPVFGSGWGGTKCRSLAVVEAAQSAGLETTSWQVIVLK